MRSFLYSLVGRSCLVFAGTVDFVGNLLVLATVKLGAFVKVSYAHLCMWLLRLIDSKRVQEEKKETENLRQSLELALMQTAVRIKESAEEDDDWTDDHSEALNMVGVRLINECQWEPAAVHKYFKPLVESIEGLDYGA